MHSYVKMSFFPQHYFANQSSLIHHSMIHVEIFCTTRTLLNVWWGKDPPKKLQLILYKSLCIEKSTCCDVEDTPQINAWTTLLIFWVMWNSQEIYCWEICTVKVAVLHIAQGDDELVLIVCGQISMRYLLTQLYLSCPKFSCIELLLCLWSQVFFVIFGPLFLPSWLLN